MKKLVRLAGMLLALAFASCGQQPVEEVSIIPVPLKAEWQGGAFVIDGQTSLWVDAPEADKQILQDYLASSPLKLSVANEVPTGKAIVLKMVEELPEIQSPEGYVLTSSEKRIDVLAKTGSGLFYGVQTLLQMAGDNNRVALGTITDEPRFEYRGMMLDVSRHFFGLDFVKKQIDAMAYYKLNRLHIHLTDAAGWRIEIKKYPRLTNFAAWRTGKNWKEWWNGDRKYVEEGSEGAEGGYFTQDQCREIVEYAKKHYITVIPEIEMPSHSEEVLTAYPELSCTHVPYKQADFCVGNEKTFEFLENVLLEVMEIFPSEYIHVGGDEASKQSWKTCPLCQARMKKEGLKDVDELQSYLIERMEKFLNKHGRNLLGWDEILEGGLAPNATVMSWRGVEGGLKAIEGGHRAIMTPGAYCYFDSYQDAPHTQPEAIGGYLPLKKVYSYDPIPETFTPEQAKLMYGVQANLWAEYIPTPEHLEYMIYPRILALAEVAWSAVANKNYDDFHARALKAVDELRAKGYNTFDLKNEVGNRPGADKPVEHLGIGKKVTYAEGHNYYSGYTAGGDDALVNGILGGWSYSDQLWQGFLKNIDLTIDLEKETSIKNVYADFMQICGPGVFMPKQVIISVSNDGKEFTELTKIDHQVVKDDAVTFKTYGWEGEANARYVRYQAEIDRNFGGFLFVDEIVIK